jgi:hypothetical protein
VPADSLPVQSGDRIETFKPGEGEPHIAAALLKALTAGGDPVDVLVNPDGSLSISAKSSPIEAATKPGNKITVGTSSGTLCIANANRQYLLVVNVEGPNDVWISLGGTATANASIPLPVGGVYELPVRYVGAVNASAPSGASAVIVVEA